MLESKTTIAIPPGATIREQLERRGLSQKEFAVRMDMSPKHICNLINGKVELTADVALRLETVLGIPADFWSNLEARYKEQVSRVKLELAFEYDEDVADRFPYSAIVKLGWVPPPQNKQTKVVELRKYFEVTNLGRLEDLKLPGISYRKVGANTSSDYALAVWAQKARVEARDIETEPINIKKLVSLLPTIRELTAKEPSVFCGELRTLLSQCGVALVFLPHIAGSFLHGASFADGNHIVLGLTVRGKYADKFWFSLFHELGHIIMGHINDYGGDKAQQEDEADNFAQNTLIPKKEYDNFLRLDNFSAEAIVSFSSKIGIAPGIVLGRLQKEDYVDYRWHHHLKEKYEIS